jgi:hypothetical protein
MEFLEECHYPINFHPEKANIMADALSRKVRMARLGVQEVQSVQEILERDAEMQGEKFHVIEVGGQLEEKNQRRSRERK